MLTLPADRAKGLCLATLGYFDMPPEDAETCADCIMFATLRGLDTHGIISVLPATLAKLRAGTIVPRPEIAIVHDTATTAVLKGNGAAGPVIGARAMDFAIAKASEHGLGAVTAHNCHHYGAASFFAARALGQGMVGLAMCNAGPVVAPFGGAKGVHGTNPIAYAVPAGEEAPLVLDIATSAAAHGQLFQAARRGQAIPLGWALDGEGKPTTDPAVGARGVLLPFGGHKGYGIGLLVDVLTGALAGSTVGLSVDQRSITPESGGQAFFMLAIDVSRFVPRGVFADRVDQLIREVHATPPAEGFSEVLVPGDLERRQEEARRRKGIPLYSEDWEAIVRGLEAADLPARELAERFGPDEA